MITVAITLTCLYVSFLFHIYKRLDFGECSRGRFGRTVYAERGKAAEYTNVGEDRELHGSTGVRAV